ncbi:patatin-like phospholipase family protein [uncultured Piscinibacter sp.]|uniref:patatin-like phospholipase family protein n=1 Tax=uncultured Piscinibacter sp. TaxID=1131835 RepID=UPI00260C5999|nr:patatin-like phospholipase family protein [uncultured Piscinibacter sp.]
MKKRSRWTDAMAAVRLAFFVMLSALVAPAGADEAPGPAGSAKRPKVCLVLSGGGARGAAHVGVLKALEKHRVPIDCIAGTSMGSLIGAAYATGMSVAEMETILEGISTELLFKEQPPRREKSMRRKLDDYTILLGPEVGVSAGKLQFGKGLVTGVQLETVLRRLSKARGFQRFDELPIPYRAVATDLVTGKPVIFSEGELANVMRASMSVPGVVAPAEFGNMILVDGMLTSNLPVETARAMGADIVIAVNVGTPLLKREALTGIGGVASQMLSILTEQNVQAALATLRPTDILITPELGDYSTGDFDHLPKIAPLGEVAADKVAERLALLAVPVGEYAAWRERQRVDVATDQRPIDEIRFDDLQRVNAQTAMAVMRTRTGQPIDQDTLDGDMRRLYGTGDFEHVNYRILEERSRRVLAVDAVEKSWGPDFVRFGLGLSSDLGGDAYFNLLGSYRRTWLNSLGAEWRTDWQVGQTSSLTSEFYQPLSPGGAFFVAPQLAFERRSTSLYQGDERIARYKTTSSLAGLDVGVNLQRYGELRFGVVRESLRPRLDTGSTELAPATSRVSQWAYRTRLVLDQLDSADFPRSGWGGGLKLFAADSGLGADQPYTKWDVNAGAAYSIGEHTFNVGMRAGGRLGSSPLPVYDQFQWGGFLQLSGYSTGQLIGQSLRYGRLMYYRRILRGTLLEGAYGGVSLEAGEVGQPLVPGNPEGWLKSVGVFIAADSPIGPAYLGYGHTEDGNSAFYFYLGRPF